MKTIITLFCLIIASSLFAQNDIKQASFGVHYSYTDFLTSAKIKSSSINNVLKNNQWAIPSEMMTGMGIDFLKGLSKKIDFAASMNYANGVNGFNLPASNLINYSLFTMDAQLNFKLVSDKYYVRPFLTTGAGMYLQNGFGAYAPIGAGLQFNIFNAAVLNLQSLYRLPLKNSENAHLFYQVGFATALSKPKSITKKLVIPESKEVSIPIPIVSVKTISKDLTVLVVDEETLIPLPSLQVNLVNDSSNTMMTYLTDASGKVNFTEIKAANYTISGALNGISTNSDSIKLDAFNNDINPLQIKLTHNDPRFTLIGKAIDSNAANPIGGVIITFVSKNQIDTTISNIHDGTFKMQLAQASDFTVSGKKSGFISNIEHLTTIGLKRSTTLYLTLTIGIESTESGKSIVMRNIYFETGKSELKTAASTDLNKLVLFLNDNPAMRVEILGYTDNVGSEKLNQKLSLNRAQSVVDYLIANKIVSKRLSAKGLGSTNPIVSNTTVEGRSKNRRVEIKVFKE